MRMPRIPRDLASWATSMSSMLRPNTSGCEWTCMSITPLARLTLGGGGGNAAPCAFTSLNVRQPNIVAAAVIATLFMFRSLFQYCARRSYPTLADALLCRASLRRLQAWNKTLLLLCDGPSAIPLIDARAC